MYRNTIKPLVLSTTVVKGSTVVGSPTHGTIYSQNLAA
jgi:hypothetical protein